MDVIDKVSGILGSDQDYHSPRPMSASLAVSLSLVAGFTSLVTQGETVTGFGLIASILLCFGGLKRVNSERHSRKAEGSILLTVGLVVMTAVAVYTSGFYGFLIFLGCWVGILSFVLGLSSSFNEDTAKTVGVATVSVILGSLIGVVTTGTIASWSNVVGLGMSVYGTFSTPESYSDTGALISFLIGSLVLLGSIYFALKTVKTAYLPGVTEENRGKHVERIEKLSYGLGFIFFISLVSVGQGIPGIGNLIDLLFAPVRLALRTLIHSGVTYTILITSITVVILYNLLWPYIPLLKRSKKGVWMRILSYSVPGVVASVAGTVVAVVSATGIVSLGGEFDPNMVNLYLGGIVAVMVIFLVGFYFLGYPLATTDPRFGVNIGVSLVFFAAILSGLTSNNVGATLISVACLVLAWDIGENAVNMGEYMSRYADTAKAEVTHATGSMIVGIGTVVVGYILYLVTKSFVINRKSMVALALLVIAVVLLSKPLSNRTKESN